MWNETNHIREQIQTALWSVISVCFVDFISRKRFVLTFLFKNRVVDLYVVTTEISEIEDVLGITG